MTTILKATSKGQITLPASWRRTFSTNQFIAKVRGAKLEIQPLDLNSIHSSEEYTVFDAIRDNKGKGVKAADLARALKELS